MLPYTRECYWHAGLNYKNNGKIDRTFVSGLQLICMVNHYKAFPELFFVFNMCRIGNNTFANWADFLTGWRVIMPDAFGTKSRLNDIDLLTY